MCIHLGLKRRVPETHVEIKGVTVKMMIDTGASTDIIDEEAFQTICQSQATQLEEDTCRIFAYGSQSRLTTLGKFNADIVANGKRATTTIHVLQGTHGSLLSFATASKLDIVDVKVRNVETDTNLIEQYPNVFKGIGRLQNYEVKLHIDDTVFHSI